MLRTCGFAYDLNYVVWGSEERENGRVSYRLKAVEGSVAGDVVGSATGSNPHLEWARGRIEKLTTENADLQQQLAEIRSSTSWRITGPLRAAVQRRPDRQR